MSATNNLQSLIYSNEGGSSPTLSVLDCLLVPHEKKYVTIPDVEAAWTVIRTMQIRGAPLIAIVACLGLSVDLATNPKTIAALESVSSTEEIQAFIFDKMEYLKTSRPTAVNLFNAMDELTDIIKAAGDKKRRNHQNRHCTRRIHARTGCIRQQSHRT